MMVRFVCDHIRINNMSLEVCRPLVAASTVSLTEGMFKVDSVLSVHSV